MSNSQKANPKASNMYLLAMLADVNARMLWDNPKNAKKESEKWADKYIQNAMDDKQGLLKNAVLSWKKYNWQVENGWKPMVTIGTSGVFNYVNNLIYLAKGIDPTNDKTIYVVSIAGTNGVSRYDWSEDFKVATQVGWKTKDDPKQIALGTWNGWFDISDMKNEHQEPLFKYLENHVGSSPDNHEIIVTGHSLGGTLAPVYALSLKERNPNWNISFYAFAGATPGNQAFADYTSQILGENQMYSFWNQMDIVPHAWDQSHMDDLKSIYVSCIGSDHSQLLNKVLEYFTDLAQDNYSRFDTKSYSSFNSEKTCMLPIDDNILSKIVKGIHVDYNITKLQKAINHLCNTKSWTEAKPCVEHFCKYLLEALGQHVQPYFYHFVEKDNNLFEEFVKAYFYVKNIHSIRKHFVDGGDAFLLLGVLKNIINTVAFDKALQQLEEKELV